MRAYLYFLRFRSWERLDKIFDLFGLYHEVVHKFLLVRFFFAPVCVREREEGMVELTLEDVGRVDLVRVTLFRDGDLLRDLDKVDAGGQIRDAA